MSYVYPLSIVVLLFTVLLPLHISAQENLAPITVENVNQLRELARWYDVSSAVAFSPDSTKLAFGSGAGDAVLIDIATGNRIRTFSGHTGTITGLSFSPDDTRLLTTSNQDNSVRLWDVESGDQIFILDQHPTAVKEAIFSPDGEKIITASAFTLYIYDTNSGDELDEITRDELLNITGLELVGQTYFNAIYFDQSGAHIIADIESGLGPGVVTLNLPVRDDPFGFQNYEDTMAVGPSGELLTAEDDGRIFLEDSQTGDRLVEFYGHAGTVTDVSISPDESVIASTGHDQTTRLWNADTGEYTEVLLPSAGMLESVAWSSDGNLLAIAGDDVTLWGIDRSSDGVERFGITIKTFQSGDTDLEPVDYGLDIPQQWFALEDGKAQYEIQIDTRANTVETCNYMPFGTVVRLQQEIIVEITNMETYEQLGSISFQGKQPEECKSSESFVMGEGRKRYYGTSPDPDQVQNWIIETMLEYGFASEPRITPTAPVTGVELP